MVVFKRDVLYSKGRIDKGNANAKDGKIRYFIQIFLLLCMVFVIDSNLFSSVKEINTINDIFDNSKSVSMQIPDRVLDKIEITEECILKYLEKTEKYQYLQKEGYHINSDEVVTRLNSFRLNNEKILFLAKIKDGLFETDNVFFLFVYSKIK